MEGISIFLISHVKSTRHLRGEGKLLALSRLDSLKSIFTKMGTKGIFILSWVSPENPFGINIEAWIVSWLLLGLLLKCFWFERCVHGCMWDEFNVLLDFYMFLVSCDRFEKERNFTFNNIESDGKVLNQYRSLGATGEAFNIWANVLHYNVDTNWHSKSPGGCNSFWSLIIMYYGRHFIMRLVAGLQSIYTFREEFTYYL